MAPQTPEQAQALLEQVLDEVRDVVPTATYKKLAHVWAALDSLKAKEQ